MTRLKNRQRVRLASLIACSLTLHLGCSAEHGVQLLDAHEPLRWEMATGDRFQVELAQEWSESSGWATSTTIDLEWNIQEVDDDGTITLEMIITRITMEVNVPNHPAVSIDSDTDMELDNPLAEQLPASLLPLIDQPIIQIMDPLGHVLSLELPEETPEGMSVVGRLAKRVVTSMLSRATAVFPERAISLGETWDTEWTWNTEWTWSSFPTNLNVKTEYTLEEFVEYEGMRCAKIQLANHFELGEPILIKSLRDLGGEEQEESREIEDQQSEGVIYFAVPEGRIVEIESRQKMHLSEGREQASPQEFTEIEIAMSCKVTLAR